MSETNPSQKTALSRQNIRKWLVVLSFILIPVTIFYISPVIILMGAADGIVTGGILIFTLIFFLSLFVGRLWCGWLCPMGAWQEICSPLMKHTVADGWRNWIKYGFMALWLAMIAYFFSRTGGVLSVSPFYGTVNGISISSLDILIVVMVIFLIIFAVAYFTGRRGFCHVICPQAGIMVLGRKIRNLVGWPALQLGADASRCTDCEKCSKECPMGLDVHGMVREEKMENAECIMCASCADTCPKGAITYGLKGKCESGKP